MVQQGEMVAPPLRQIHADSTENIGNKFRTIQTAAVGHVVRMVKRNPLRIQTQPLTAHLRKRILGGVVPEHTNRARTVVTQIKRQGILFQNLLPSCILRLTGNCMQHTPAALITDKQPDMRIHRIAVGCNHRTALQPVTHPENQIALPQQSCINLRKKRSLPLQPVRPGAGCKYQGEKNGEKRQDESTWTSGQSSTHRPSLPAPTHPPAHRRCRTHALPTRWQANRCRPNP